MSFDPPTSSDSQAYDSAQDAERVELIGSAVVSGTVDQGTGGTSAWLVNVNGVPHVIIDAATIAALTDGTQRIGGTVAVSGPLTDTQLRAVAVPVSGSVSVSNLPATQPVSGTVAVSAVGGTVTVDGSGHTQPVSGAVSVSNLPATQPVSGTVAVSAVSGTVTTDGSGHTQPVSGSVSVSNLPATQPVSGSVSVSNFPATQPVSGTVTASGPLTDTQLRAAAVHVAVDSATIAALTDGTQRIGGTVLVDGSGVTQPVSGTFYQATQPVSAASLPLPTDAATDATVSSVETAVRELEFDSWLRSEHDRWA